MVKGEVVERQDGDHFAKHILIESSHRQIGECRKHKIVFKQMEKGGAPEDGRKCGIDFVGLPHGLSGKCPGVGMPVFQGRGSAGHRERECYVVAHPEAHPVSATHSAFGVCSFHRRLKGGVQICSIPLTHPLESLGHKNTPPFQWREQWRKIR